MKTINGMLLGFLLGGVIGGAIALLYAPQKGKHLRKDISKKTNKLIDEGKKKTSDLWNDTKEKTESVLESANDILNTGVEKIAHETEKVKAGLKSKFNT